MTPEEAVALLDELTYKPKWRLYAYSVPGAVVFRAGSMEPCTVEWFRTKREVPREVVLTESIENGALLTMTEEHLLRWAFDVLVRREVHEVEEWLRRDDRPVFSPHPGREVGILGDGTSTPT